MSSFTAIEPNQAQGKARESLAAVQKMLGATPNMFRVAAQAPAALESLVAQFGALAGGLLNPKVRESIALAVAEANGCDYCLSAHTALGKGAGLSEDDLTRARSGEPTDPKLAAIVKFAREAVGQHGQVTAETLQSARTAGVTDPEMLEVVANVALNVFTNYLNLVARTEIDFPVIRARR